MIEPSAGSMRAAKMLFQQGIMVYEECAKIIDQETGLPDLINAVQQALQCLIEEYWDGESYNGNGKEYAENLEQVLIKVHGEESGIEIIAKIKGMQ